MSKKAMVSDAFGVGSEPFRISSDPRFIYFDPKLLREYQVLLNGLRSGIGVAVVTGERGVGKTMLLHRLAAELDVADHLVVYVSCLGSPSLGDIMAAFGFRIGFPGQPKANREVKPRTSLAEMLGFVGVCGTSAILFLDDADSLGAETLSGLLSMSDQGVENGAIVSIVLAGSLDLAPRLERIRNPSSDKRLDLIIPLSPLAPEDVEPYISHRLQMAAHGRAQIFQPEAIERIANYSRGNPQAINRICRAAMVIAAGQSQETVSKTMVEQVTWSERTRPNQSSSHSGESPARSRDDWGFDDAHGDTKPALEVVTPSGREANAGPTVEVLDFPRRRTRGPGRRKWVTVGVLSAFATVALYLVASGDTQDEKPIATEFPSGISAEHNEEDPSQTPIVATSASEQNELFRLEDEFSQPLEWQETMPVPREAWVSALEQAVYRGDVKALNALLDAGADINAPVSGGRTPLMVAANRGDEAIVVSLIDRGADLSLGTVDITAARASPVAVDTWKTASGEGHNADLRRQFGPELLTSTAGDGRSPLVRGQLPTDPSEPDIPITDAANTGAEPETRKALSTEIGVTPLIAAAGAGHADVVDILLAAGADVNAADARGRTPLIAAVDAGDRVSAGLLLARNAHILAVDDTGQSALDIARENSRWDLVDLISARAKPLSVKDKPLPVETTALQLSSPTAQQTLTPVRSVAPEKTAQVIQWGPKASRVEPQSAPGGVRNRALVLQTQGYLHQLGYDSGPIDGISGVKTRSAVRRFQSDRGIKVDGRITLSLLKSLAAEADTQETGRVTAQAETAPGIRGFFLSMLGELQNLRGLKFDSTKDPGEISVYCGKNRDTWIYDRGIRETIYCENYVRSKTL